MTEGKPVKRSWQDKVNSIALFHDSYVKDNPKWSMRATAYELGYSIGFVSEALQLFYWMRVYPRLELIAKKSDALIYMREKIKKHENNRDRTQSKTG